MPKIPRLPSSEITPESVWVDRRRFLAAAGAAGAGLLGAGALSRLAAAPQPQRPLGTPYGLQPGDEPTSYEDVTTYNNFYEFGTSKDDPAVEAQGFRTRPWTVRVDGLCAKPGNYQLEDFLKPSRVEDRIYR
ncbi:MAG: mononuclear molybdenum enzyme YedY, partial [Gemmatimonadota bacterium]|nr:mononuclear molybdenum enzyme YedY [Gemmatimonadota bacterium]